MNNTTTYSIELLAKSETAVYAKQRRMCRISAVCMLVLGVFNGVTAFMYDEMFSMYLGVSTTICLLVAVMYLFRAGQFSMSKATKRAEQYLRTYSFCTMEYTFEADYLRIEQKTEQIHNISFVRYPMIARLTRVDDRTLYLFLKNRQSYILYDENGVEGMYGLLLSKLPAPTGGFKL